MRKPLVPPPSPLKGNRELPLRRTLRMNCLATSPDPLDPSTKSHPSPPLLPLLKMRTRNPLRRRGPRVRCASLSVLLLPLELPGSVLFPSSRLGSRIAGADPLPVLAMSMARIGLRPRSSATHALTGRGAALLVTRSVKGLPALVVLVLPHALSLQFTPPLTRGSSFTQLPAPSQPPKKSFLVIPCSPD